MEKEPEGRRVEGTHDRPRQYIACPRCGHIINTYEELHYCPKAEPLTLKLSRIPATTASTIPNLKLPVKFQNIIKIRSR